MTNKKTSTPFFTIIIPTLNEERHLPLLLTNLTKQTFTKFQVIIVDGKSSDQTKTKALEFQNQLDLTFKQTSVRNASYQRNLGAKQSKTKYLVFFDADTRIPKNYLQKIYSYLKNHPIDILTTWIKPDTQLASDQLIAQFTNQSMEILKHFNPAAIASHMVVRTTSFQKTGGFNTQVEFGEDIVLVRTIVKNGGKFHILKHPKAVFCFRRFHREGRARALTKYLLLHMHIALRDPTQPPPLTYPMGGTQQKSQLQSRRLKKLQTQIDKLVDQFRQFSTPNNKSSHI